MSDLMRPIPYSQLLDWVLEEYRKKGSIFGISKIVKRGGGLFPIFEGGIETVFGPAAGPNTQLSQNLIAAYACLLYTSPSPRDKRQSRMPSSA